MADIALAVAGLTVQVSEALKQLYEFGRDVKGAQDSIHKLCSELVALKGVLPDVQAYVGHRPCPEALLLAVKNALADLNALLEALAPQYTKWKRVKQSLTWPLKSSEVDKILGALERVKSLLVLDLVGDLRTTLSDFTDLKDDIKYIKADSNRRLQQDETDANRKVLNFLAPSSPLNAHRKACSVWRTSSSGSWFLDGPFQSWRDGDYAKTPVLILFGKSGAGKSTIISKTIETSLARSQDYRVGFMYCTRNENASQEVRNVLGAWIAQLATHSPVRLERFQKYVDKQDELNLAKLMDEIIDIANQEGPVVLFLDAINESKEPLKLGSCIQKLVQRSTKIRVVLSSTLNASIIFRGNEQSLLQVNMQPSLVGMDIEQYLRRRRAEHPVLQRISEAEIIQAIVPRAKGMFRWASCQMTILEEQLTPKLARETLKQLPGTLDATYVTLLMRVPRQARHVVRETLTWLSYSIRPMTLNELIDAVFIEIGDEDFDIDCRLQPPERIIELCHGLVDQDPGTDLMSLAHGSVRAFLESDFIKTSPVAYFAIDADLATHTIIQKSLTYLLMDRFKVENASRNAAQGLKDEYPLLEYASYNWPIHAYEYSRVKGRLEEEDLKMIEKLFRSHKTDQFGGSFTFWIRCMMNNKNQDVILAAEPLYYAASFGLSQVVESMIVKGLVSSDENSDEWYIDHHCGSAFSTALQVACWRGHVSVVALLLQAGADPNSTNQVGVTCTYCATTLECPCIERLLRQAGGRDGLFPDYSLNESGSHWSRLPYGYGRELHYSLTPCPYVFARSGDSRTV